MIFVDTVGDLIDVETLEEGVKFIYDAYKAGEDTEGWLVCYRPDFSEVGEHK